jgi:hypothetical protein
MVLTDDEITAMGAKALAAVKSLGILHNAGAVLGTALILIIIWTSLVNGHKWAFWTILGAGIWGNAMWFLSVRYIDNQTLGVNGIFAAIFLLGISLASIGVFK